MVRSDEPFSRVDSVHESLRAAALGLVMLLGVQPGCGNPGIESARKSVDAMQQLVDLLASVQDEATARAAVGKVAPVYQQFTDAYAEALAAAGENGEIRGLKSQVDQLEADLARLPNEIERHRKRLEALHGLPEEFWSEIRVADLKASAKLLDSIAAAAGADPSLLMGADQSIAAVLAAYEQYGPPKVAEATIRGGRDYDREEAVERLRQLAGPAATVTVFPDEQSGVELTAVLAPVDDMQAFHDAIDFASVADYFPERSAVILEVTEELAGPFAGMSEEEIAQRKQWEAEQAEAERQRQEEAERLAAEQRAREEEEARLRAEEEERQRPPEPGTSNYFEKLLANVQDPQAPHHALAVEHLLDMKPDEAPDDKTRAQIVAALRELAAGGNPGLGSGDARSDGIRGYVLWAGAESVPVLIGLAKDAQTDIDQAIVDGLAQYPTAEGAAVLAALVKTSQQNRDAIADAIASMGPVAEEPLLALVPDESDEVNLTVIRALGQCGTKASLRTMRAAARSDNEEVAQAARDAANAIRERSREAEN